MRCIICLNSAFCRNWTIREHRENKEFSERKAVALPDSRWEFFHFDSRLPNTLSQTPFLDDAMIGALMVVYRERWAVGASNPYLIRAISSHIDPRLQKWMRWPKYILPESEVSNEL